MAERGQGLNERFIPSHRDQLGNIQSALLATPVWTTESYRDTGSIFNFLRHDQDDYFQIKCQFNHDKKPNTNLDSIHIHAVPMANVTGDVYFAYSYVWIKNGDELPAIAGWTTSNIAITVAGTDQYKNKIYNLVTNISAPANETASSILVCKIQRLGTNLLDTYNTDKPIVVGGQTAAANFMIIDVDPHYIVDRIGSDTESTHL